MTGNTLPQAGEGPDSLIQKAGKALYATKAAGRERVQLYDQGVVQSVG